MDFLMDLGHNEIKAEGNNPLILDSGKIWLVKEGQIDLYVARISNGEVTGRRKYLFSVPARELLLGNEPIALKEDYGLLAVGFTGTRILEIDLQSLDVTAGDNIKKLTGLLNNWIENWTGAGLTETPQIDWNAGLKPLFESILHFNKNSFNHVLGIFINQQQEEILRNKTKAEKDNAFMSAGLNRLINSMDLKQRPDADTEETVVDDLLFKACVAVGNAKDIKIVAPRGIKNKEAESKDPLGDITRASQVRTRQVILKDAWWKEDNGSLLAYKEGNGDEQPVALLPLSPKKYHLYDPSDETRVVVDDSVASNIKPHAYTFYRPLPAKKIGYKDLLSFLAGGIWKRDLATVLVMGILGGLLGVLTPVVTGIVFDSVIPDGEKVLLTHIGFLLIAIAITTFAFNLTRAFAMHRIEGRTESDLQAAIWDRLLSLPVPFFKDYNAGELAERAMGISQIRSILSGTVINTVISTIFSVFYFFLLFYYSWKLALICLAIVTVVMGISLLFGYLQIRYERQLVDKRNKLAGKVFNLLSGVGKIKTSGAEKPAFHNWAKQFGEVRDITFRKENLGNKLAVFNSTVNVIATGIIFYCVISLENINLAAGTFIAFNAAFSKFLSSMLEISNVVLQLNIIKPLYERTKPILEAVPEYDQEKADPGELKGNIEVSHLNFRYETEGPLILDDVTLEIKQGDYVGIVGTSGSGKSTLFRILLGFEKPESGQVYYDQQDLENVDIRAIRRQLGVVLQGGQLMSGSIFDNIVSANPGLNINDAWEAARMAGMEEDIKSMPMGMHTMVSENGGTLSGGQKQRLLIARAIITKPKIVYFDEATSALDNRTQKIVSQSLSVLNATRVLIAHRLSTIADCNKIIVLDRGRVVEYGTYHELFEQNGIFTQLVKRQLA